MSKRKLTNLVYDGFREFLEQACGIVLGDNKHYLVSSRLNRLIDKYGFTSYGELLDQLRSNKYPSLQESVINAMTTNETLWFRDQYPFDIAQHVIFPEYARLKCRPFRIWSAACSSGQEPYSLSILVQEYIAKHPGSFAAGVQIIATDISSSMLQECHQGMYDTAVLSRGLSEARKKKFLTECGRQWKVKPEIKNRVEFKNLNLQNSYIGLGKFDVIFCRNVLIYFSSEFKKDILNRLGDVLHPKAYLMLGGSETPNRYTDIYQMLRTSQGVVYQKIE